MFLCYYQCRGWSLFCKCSQSRMCLCWIALPLPRSSSRLSNGETESVKTMIVHDEGESDAGSTPCKDSTLIVRQVLAGRKKTRQASQSFTTYDSFSVVYFVHSYPKCFSILFLFCWSCSVLSFVVADGEQLSVTKCKGLAWVAYYTSELSRVHIVERL